MGNRTVQVAAEPTVELSVVAEQPAPIPQEWVHACMSIQPIESKTISGECPHCHADKPGDLAKALHIATHPANHAINMPIESKEVLEFRRKLNEEEKQRQRCNDRKFCCQCTICVIAILGAGPTFVTLMTLY